MPSASSPHAGASTVACPPAAAGRMLPPASPLPLHWAAHLGVANSKPSGETKPRPTHLLGIWEAGAGVTRPGGAGKSTLLTDTCYVHVCYRTRHTRG